MSAPPSSPRKNITQILIEAGVVTEPQVQAGLERQRATGKRIGETLVELGYVSEEDIAWALARQLGLSFVDVRADTLDPELVKSFPESTLRRLQVVPLVRSDEQLALAAADPTDPDLVRELERLTGVAVSCVASTPSAIERALDAVWGSRHSRRSHPAPAPPLAQAAKGAAPHFDVVWDKSGDTFFQFHLSRATSAGAHEVHFLGSQSSLRVLHRVGAVLQKVADEPAQLAELVLARLESLGMPPAGEGSSHRVQALECEIGGMEGEILASRLVTNGRLSVTVRLLRDPTDHATLDSLGLEAIDLARLRAVAAEPAGLVLVSGPTGSGCSTTLAALLRELPTEDRRWLVFANHHRRWNSGSGLVEVVSGRLARHWSGIAVVQGADGLVLDDGLSGKRVRRVLGSATHARWVLARTDWEEPFALLEAMSATPEGRALLSRRWHAVIQQRLVSVANSGGASSGGAARRAVFAPLFATDAMRAAILRGANAGELRALAQADGFRLLPDRVRDLVERGELDPGDAARAVS
ncbi:MAG TPA: ATPase, T2SS/T4P/T4SS family [Candidatus Sulfotelmatobacter sp.]|nr:ATPase, T2SS/T4P/T4SS family [Candidatus Sulfotelmatobacter sp.]